jgi:NAD-dependent aldehyde dehydrogenases
LKYVSKLSTKLAQTIQQRREEIIQWLIDESGSTRLKANIEVDAALGIIQESLCFPEKMQTIELESKDPSRKSFVLAQTLGCHCGD